MFQFWNKGKDPISDASSLPPMSYSPSSSPSSSASPVTGPARPIRLVYCDEKGKFRMDPEAVATLQLVKEPIGVVSVCGRARQGKSFILNQVCLFFSPFFLSLLMTKQWEKFRRSFCFDKFPFSRAIQGLFVILLICVSCVGSDH